MNFLAHLYLSGESDEIKLGNFMGDYVKGNKYLSFPENIQTGILMHRQIDTFTDNHPIVKECSKLLKPAYNRYSGIIIDLFFDHFLASQWEEYSSISLKEFAHKTHRLLFKNFLILPGQVKQFLPFLVKNKRLMSYASIDGIIRSIEIMSNYTSLPEENGFAREILVDHYQLLNKQFKTFFQEITNFIEENYQLEIKKPV